MRTHLGKPKPVPIRILFDSGASKSILFQGLVKKLRLKKTIPTEWNTAAGKMKTSHTAKVQFMLTEFDGRKVIEWEFHTAEQEFSYDMIIGRDLLTELGIIINFKEANVTWDGVTIGMKDVHATVQDSYFVEDSATVTDATNRVKAILDAKYQKANLDEEVQKCSHLSTTEQQGLRDLLGKYESLFDGTLGKWQGEPYDIQLKENVQPYHAKPFPIPRIHETTLKMEVDRLVNIGVLKKVNRSEWAAPIFIIPKKDGTVRFINNF